MTEEEAKTKLCVHQPFVRRALTTNGDVTQTYYEPRCMGSQCMAWRWNSWREFPPGAHTSTPPSMMQKSETEGYCGLAGK